MSTPRAQGHDRAVQRHRQNLRTVSRMTAYQVTEEDRRNRPDLFRWPCWSWAMKSTVG